MINMLLKATILIVVIMPYLYYMVLLPYQTGGWELLMSVLYRWQTFNAGMVALIAAGITAAVAIKSDKAAWARHNDAIEREFNAMQLLLNSPLRSIIEHIDYCIHEVLDYYIFIEKHGEDKKEELKWITVNNISKAGKPKGHEKIFTDFIKLSSGREKKVENILAGILCQINIFMTRLHLIEKGVENSPTQEKESLMTTIVIGLIVKQMAFDLLPYANNKSPVKELFTRKEIYKDLIFYYLKEKNINTEKALISNIERIASRIIHDFDLN